MSLLMGRHLPHFQPSLQQHFDFVFSLPSLVGELRLYRLPWLYTWLMSCRLKPFCNLVRVILEQNKCSSTLSCWLALVALLLLKIHEFAFEVDWFSNRCLSCLMWWWPLVSSIVFFGLANCLSGAFHHANSSMACVDSGYCFFRL